MRLAISEFLPNQRSDQDIQEWYDVIVAALRKESPDLPLPAFDAYLDQTRRPVGPLGPRLMWAARIGREIVGTAVVSFPDSENAHMAVVAIHVRPDAQRQGIATQLLRVALPQIHASGRKLVAGLSLQVGLSGQLWATALGFRTVQEVLGQILRVQEVDPSLWDVEAPAGFIARRWVGRTPDELVDSYARARTAIEDAPLGESSIVHPRWTVERVRQAEHDAERLGEEHFVVVAIHEQTGAVAAITEVALKASRPEHGAQRDTAVLRAYRGNGLGVFVKAAMMRWLVEERPQIRQIITSNAPDNEHMILVNNRIGYVLLSRVANAEAGLDELSARLA